MTNSYTFESDVMNGVYDLTIHINDVPSGSFDIYFTYGNLYTFLHNYNIDVIDENDKIKIINNSDNKYYITLEQLDKIISISLEPKALDQTPIRLNVASLFGSEDPCATPVKDNILNSDLFEESNYDFPSGDVLFYFRNLELETKSISLSTVSDDGGFYQPTIVDNPTLTSRYDLMSVSLASNSCERVDPCTYATPTIIIGSLNDGGMYEFYINDQLIEQTHSAFRRDLVGSLKTILESYNVNLIPLYEDFVEVSLEADRYQGAELGKFVNNSNQIIRIKILTLDANSIDRVYPDTGNDSYTYIEGIDRGIEFCLSIIP